MNTNSAGGLNVRYWIDVKPEALDALTEKDRAAVEVACWAWEPFYRFASMFEEHKREWGEASSARN